ncbi:hypothetical protein [Burkholderia cenocepacia]|uniref:hypothetical protein n=1 Tax=Burkholderia cenocepacia TaxID=95486 RepID=UPI002865E3F2|nr:hypothetical protein [Burkholderia cenocepacia]MDR8069431.1 hypothetical protein [Burkholderia cenocepacia]
MDEIATGGLDDLSPLEMRKKVAALEAEVRKLPQVDCPVRHHFAPGIYAREMTIPAGVVATGAVHKTEHLTIISKGRLHITTDDGMREFAAPAIFKSMPGTKRAAYAIEEAVLTTIHATDTTDLDELVEELTESTSRQLLGGSENLQLLNERKELTK